MFNGLDVFSGIGGLSLALEPWVRPIAYCEIDAYCRSVLLSRMADGRLPVAPIWDDVRTLHSGRLPVRIDAIYGGFPCQGISVAGLGKGLEDERSGLYWELHRLVDEIKPRCVFLENVPAITGRGGIEVVRSLAALGYDCRWTVLSAVSVGALHKRERWWLLAHTKGLPPGGLPQRTEQAESGSGFCHQNVAHATGQRQRKQANKTQSVSACRQARDESGDGGESMADANSSRELQQSGTFPKFGQRAGYGGQNVADANGSRCEEFDAATKPTPAEHGTGRDAAIWSSDWWATEPSVGRLANGLPNRLDRLRALGNAVVPLQARTAFKILAGITGDLP